ncbi:MAG TPA: replicative DNA helicase [Pirellulales bacterium]|jgi:replicative DNA helicase|nr:replicative DNA helicase [Pirellulales bacterium]
MATVDRKANPKPRKPPVTSEILDRQPPRSLEAEKAVLGSILLLPYVCDDVALVIRPDDFYDDANRCIFQHFLDLQNLSRQIDMALLVERLRTAGEYEKIGGAGYLAEIARSVPTAANAVHYAEIVRDKALLRGLIGSSTEILRDAYEDGSDPREQLNRAEQKIFAILSEGQTSSVVSAHDLIHEAMLRIEQREKGEHKVAGVDCGFPGIDELTGGLHNGELIIIAARPSMGKTAFALNLAEYAATELKVPSLVCSLEMSAIELADRLLCSSARVDSHRLRNGRATVDERKKLIEAAAVLTQSPLFLDDSPSRTVLEINAVARRLRRTQKLGLIVIDYLQLVEPDNPKDNRQEQVARIARRLKGMARELDVPVVCLAQLNRQAEQTGDHLPRLSHLRESGAIEQDADVVMFVHREEYYLTPEEREKEKQDGNPRGLLGGAQIIISKQRNGPTGEVKLHWKHEFTRFETLTQKPYEDFEQFAPSSEPF